MMAGDDMGKRLPKGCIEDRDRHGNHRVYYRPKKGMSKIRLHGTPWGSEFMAAYQAAIDGTPVPSPNAVVKPGPPIRKPAGEGTWRFLCERYFAAPEFTGNLDARTRKVRRSILELTFEEPIAPGSPLKFADFPLARFTPKAVRALRDRRADAPEAANARLKAMRQAFAYGIAAQLAESNPARDVPYLRGQVDGHHTWSLEEVGRFVGRHPPGTKGYLALALLLFTGCRRADVVAFGRQHISKGWLHYTQNKNRNRDPVTLDLPVLPVLTAAIAAMPPRPAGHEQELAFLITQFGRAFTANGFGNWFRKRCTEAGLPHCSAHGLRKAGASIAAENGATEAQLMAIFGWRNPKQAAFYTRKARQKVLAGAAMHLISLDELGTVRVPPNGDDDPGGTFSALSG